MKKIGVIGTGHMGGALVRGWIRANYLQPDNIYLAGGRNSGVTQRLAEELGCHYCVKNIDVAAQCDIIVLGVPAVSILPVLEELSSFLNDTKIVISVAAAQPLANLKQKASATHIVRAVPNMPVEVCAGLTALSFEANTSADIQKEITALFASVGTVAELPENKLEIASTISGCSPAFAAMFAEALADAGVLYGLSREDSYLFAEQALLGSMQMLLQKKQPPSALKDAVCSPGGTTIKGVAALEEHGMRNAVIQAVKAIRG